MVGAGGDDSDWHRQLVDRLSQRVVLSGNLARENAALFSMLYCTTGLLWERERIPFANEGGGFLALVSVDDD